MITKAQMYAVDTVLEAAKAWLEDLETGIEGGYYDDTEKGGEEAAEVREAIALLENSNLVTGEMKL